mgnify:CR=1 FL=1|jgi:hypothetical protein
MRNKKQPIEIKQEDIDRFGIKLEQIDTEYVNGVLNGKYKLEISPTNNNNRGLLQASYWIANKNIYKAREILKGLGFPNKFIKVYIDDETRCQKEYPEEFGPLIGKPMPEEFKMKGLN